MTYSSQSPILASDYNNFSTAMKSVYGDSHSGAITINDGADYGYGQTTTLNNVAIDSVIYASQWAELFKSVTQSGIHQAVSTSGVPASGPNVGDTIIAWPSLPSAISAVVAGRHNPLPVGQTNLATSSFSSSTPWSNSLTMTYRVDFSSWNNARYFFNTSGKILLSGTYTPSVSPEYGEDYVWDHMLSYMSPLAFNWNSTIPANGTGSGVGFYGPNATAPLSTSYQSIYNVTWNDIDPSHDHYYYYQNNYINVSVCLGAPAGSSPVSLIFKVTMVDLDQFVIVPKTGTTSFTIGIVSSVKNGSNQGVAYPGPAPTVTLIGFAQT